MRRRITVRRLLALGLLSAIVWAWAVMAGCGGGAKGRAGGQVTILQSVFPDYLDPALSFTAEGWQPLTQVYPGLLTFRHASGRAGAVVEPALAQSLPRVSADGLTYRLTLRRNLNFSDGRPIRASDAKRSIERVIATDSQGAGLGYGDIVGVEQFSKTKQGGISGIQADDATGEITIRLAKARGAFTYELAIPFAGVVPASTPTKNQTQHPPPGAGRYVIQSVQQGRGYTLVKNPRFSPGLAGTAVDVGKVDRINVRIVRNPSAEVTEVAANRADFMTDNPTGGRAGEVRRRYGGKRYREFPTTSTYYFFMNASVPPFDKLAVRQAVNYALDFDALNRVQDGFLERTHQILPKQIPGYEPSRDLYPGPDLNRARQLIRTAGAEGANVTVWSNDADPTPQTTAYYADLLNRIGLKAKLKTVAADPYFSLVGDPSVKAQTGFANWSADYPHPADFIDNLLNPDGISKVNNINLSQNGSDRGFAQRINALAAQQLNRRTEQGWAALDRYAQQQAYWAVYATRKQSTFFSTRMDFAHCKGDDWPLATHDWARFCLK
jgi:peptide/nickel transport system substrate-binding protein